MIFFYDDMYIVEDLWIKTIIAYFIFPGKAMKRTFVGVVGPVMSTNYFMLLTLIMFSQ